MSESQSGQQYDGDWGVSFINQLTLCGSYSGQPMKLRDWQEKDVRAIFKRKDELTNQYKRVFLLYPRGQAKTQLLASVIVARLLGDQRHGQSIYSAAKTHKQSGLIFDRCAQIIRQDPYLDGLCEISDFKKRIEVKSRYSSFTALTHDQSGGATLGLDPSMVVVDEYCAFGRKRDFVSALETSLGKRKDQQLILISTAGTVGSLVEEETIFAKRIVEDPSIDPTYYASLHYLENDAKCLCGKHTEGWLCPDQWHRVNKALGDFKEVGAMTSMSIQAVDNPAKKMEFCRFHLNMTMHDTEALIPIEEYREGQKVVVDDEDFINEQTFAGLDLAAVSDFSAMSVICKKDDGVKVKSWYWIPEDTLVEQARLTKMPLQQWVKDGWITATPGNVTDFDVIRKDIIAIADKYKMQMVAVDPYNAVQLTTQLAQDGIPLQMFRQGFLSFNAPTCELVRLVKARQLHTGQDPVMAWMMENAQAVYDAAGNVKVDRRDRSLKIDGVVTVIEAIGVAGLSEGSKESVYESRGALIF